MATALDHVILSWPKNLSDTTEVQTSGKAKSWIQLARTGAFKSNRYGAFSITKNDLSTMLHNFNHVTPKSPTELPIDYDHLSMAPKKPGDGIAAGWMKKVELRREGDELWAEVEWTNEGARRIEAGEYRYISPSFVKDHTHKDGTKIGTTLLAAAVTNHPFLEGMSALTLYNFSALGDLAVNDTVVSLSEIGQRVMVAPGNARTHDEVGGTFEIHEVVGEGEDAFVALKDVNGVVHKWFRATELLPATATPEGLPKANLTPGQLPPRIDGLPVDPAAAAAAATGQPGVDPAATDQKTFAKAGEASDAPAGADAKNDEGDPVKSGEEVAAPHPDIADVADDVQDDAAAAAVAVPGAPAPAATPFVKGAPAGDDEKKKQQPKAAVAAKRINMSQVYTLRDDKDQEITVTAEQLAAAGITVLSADEKKSLDDKVVQLSSQVETLATAAADSRKSAHKIALNAGLEGLSNKGLITKATRDWAASQFGDATNLDSFNAWAATCTTQVVNLGGEQGSGVDGAKDDSTDQLMNLADQFVKEKGVSVRDAIIMASAQLPEAAERYREQFAN